MKITLPTEMSSIDETTTHTIKAVITWGDWLPQKILAIDADYRDTVACFRWGSGRVLWLLTPLFGGNSFQQWSHVVVSQLLGFTVGLLLKNITVTNMLQSLWLWFLAAEFAIAARNVASR